MPLGDRGRELRPRSVGDWLRGRAAGLASLGGPPAELRPRLVGDRLGGRALPNAGATGGVCERRRPQHPCSERRSQLELLLVSGWRRLAVCKCFEP